MKTPIRLALAGLGLCVTLLGAGCSTALRSAPDATPLINMNLNRSDYEIMGDVEETSEVTSYCGLVHIVDNDPSKMIIFGYRTFEDQYEEVSNGAFADTFAAIRHFFSGGDPVERANYTALTAAEAKGADLIIPKRIQRTTRGFGIFYSVETATVKGKAIRIKEEGGLNK